jgi:hypothetical protein
MIACPFCLSDQVHTVHEGRYHRGNQPDIDLVVLGCQVCRREFAVKVTWEGVELYGPQGWGP